MPVFLSFDQVMGMVRSTGTDRLLIRVEVGDCGLDKKGSRKPGRAVQILCDPQMADDGDLAQKLLGALKMAAESYDRDRKP